MQRRLDTNKQCAIKIHDTNSRYTCLFMPCTRLPEQGCCFLPSHCPPLSLVFLLIHIYMATTLPPPPLLHLISVSEYERRNVVFNISRVLLSIDGLRQGLSDYRATCAVYTIDSRSLSFLSVRAHAAAFHIVQLDGQCKCRTMAESSLSDKMIVCVSRTSPSCTCAAHRAHTIMCIY